MSSAYDLTGPVFPQALRLARYQASVTLPQSVKDIQSENDTVNQTPSREEERLLVSNAKIMTTLENLFSWSEKDPTCRTSKLSRVESIRFQRAMYRIWVMSVLFGPRRFVSSLGLADKKLDRKSDLNKSWKDQKAFLEQFSSRELFQIHVLAGYLALVANWAIRAEGGDQRQARDWDGLCLFAGPHVILRCYEDETSSYLPKEYLDDDGPHTNFLMHASWKIIQERQLETSPLYDHYIGVVLDDINAEHYRCCHCDYNHFEGMATGLWSEMNWDDLKGRLDWDSLVARNLSFNLLEEPLIQALRGDWSKLLHEMYACRSDEYAEWSKEDWICWDCWSSLFKDTLWRWRLMQKQKTGEHIKTDCRYGYDCEEQCHESGLAHAKEFNHLCEPTEEASETETSSPSGSDCEED